MQVQKRCLTFMKNFARPAATSLFRHTKELADSIRIGFDENHLLEETDEFESLNDTDGAIGDIIINGEYEEDDVVDLGEMIEEETDSEPSDSDCEY
uniref:Uncharacterized protein n=1 Tax=Caenorhabditis japonica TaxID=281687 RepID=A0A8R1IFQ1_CAEJA